MNSYTSSSETGAATALARVPSNGAARYVAQVAVAFAMSLAVIAVVLAAAHSFGVLPPAPLTGNLSFDEKALFVRNALPYEYPIVAAGSSMTLNNLSTDALAAGLPGHPRILNIGAWNMKIGDTRRWLAHVMRSTHPKVVITVTGLMDFYPQEHWLSGGEPQLDAYLTRIPYGWFIARNLSLIYYVQHAPIIARDRRSRKTYDSLAFDSGGAVPLEVEYPAIDQTRWNEVPKPELLDEEQYQQFSLMSRDLSSQGVQLIVAQAPLRKRVLADGRLAAVEVHWRRLESILAKQGHRFINLGKNLDFDDSYFADYSHLNYRGAVIFSSELAGRISTMSTPDSALPGLR